jgi:hypothetical protein
MWGHVMVDASEIAGARRADFARGIALDAKTLLEWWTGAAKSLIPQWLITAYMPSRRWVYLRETPTGYFVSETPDGAAEDLATSRQAQQLAHGSDALLILSRDDVFLRRKTLPAASASHVQQVMRLQIPIETPFDMAEVASDTLVDPAADSSNQIEVHQAIIRCDVVDAHRAALSRHGISLAGLDVASSNGTPMGFNLLDPALRTRMDATWPKLNRILTLAVLGLVGAAIALGWISRERQIEMLRSMIVAAEADAKQVLLIQSNLRDEIEIRRMIERRTSAPSRFPQLYASLTETIPDNTWIEALTFDEQSLSLIGLSRSSDTLIETLENTPGIVSARFVSPVVSDGRLEADRFRIEIILEQPVPLSRSVEDNG